MASQQEINNGQNVQPKDCQYSADGGHWTLPTEDNPTAHLSQAIKFTIAGKVENVVKKLRTVFIEFDQTVGATFIGAIHIQLYEKDGGHYYDDSKVVQFKPNESSVKAQFSIPEHAGPLDKTGAVTFQLQGISSMKPPVCVTFSGAKVSTKGDE